MTTSINIGGLSAEIPADWQTQGMLTLTLPSSDKNVRPNVIVTKEYLPGPMGLNEYFGRIKDSITKRGIQDLKVTDERDLAISGVKGKLMVCQWDVSAMAAMMSKENPNQPPPNVKPGQMVKQVQVTLLKDSLAINMTASFPADQFDTYYKPFQQFLKSLKIS